MKRVVIVLIALGAVTTGSLLGGTQANAKPHGAPVYIALGDEVAFGLGLSDPSESYVRQFAGFLESSHGLKKDALIMNLAADDQTIGDVLGNQLPNAIAEIEARNSDKDKKNDVRVITINAGLLDLFSHLLVCTDDTFEQCVNSFDVTLFFFSSFLDLTLEALRDAGGSDLQVMVMTNYNPFLNPECFFSFLAPAWEIALEGSPEFGIEQGMNDIIRSTAAAHGAQIADVYGQLGPEHLRADCGDTYSPNAAGHAVIAQRFVEAFTK